MQVLDQTRPTGAIGDKAEEEEIEVTWKDQKLINQFSNLNIKRNKLKNLIKTKSLELDDLIELENDLLLSSFDDDVPDATTDDVDHNCMDNDLIMYKLDSSYVHIKRSQFQENQLSKRLEDLKNKISHFNSDLSNLEEEMSDLKKVLYSKFGNTINLESGEDEDEEDII